MNFNHLKVFIDVSETLSFSQSAQNLNIAQPAVSRTIRNLEKDLEAQLFTRNNRKVFLTEEGKNLFLEISPLLKKIEQIVLKTKENEFSMTGELRIGALVEFSEFQLLPIINKLNSEFPEIRFKIEMRGDRELRELFLEGRLDIYLGIKPMDAENIRSYKCFNQKSLLLTNSKTNVKIKDLENTRFVAYRDNDPLILAYLKKYFPKRSYQLIKKVFIANSHKAMVDYLIYNEDCYAILPELSSSVVDSLKKKKLKVVKNQFLDSPIYMSYWDHDFMSPLLQKFINSLKKA